MLLPEHTEATSESTVLLRFSGSRFIVYNSSGLRRQDGHPFNFFPMAGRHRVSCQHLIGHLDVGQGDQSQGPDNSQALLLTVEVGACARYIIKFFPERKEMFI